MTEHVLVAVDNSDPARKAVDFVHSTFPNAEVTLLHVTIPMIDTAIYEDPPDLEEMRERLAEFEDELTEAGISVDVEVVTGRPRREIVDYAETADVDHVIVGSHGRTGPTRVLLGSVAETVARRSPVPVTIVR
ncbi:universal stress protein [Halalkalicoccus sp. NIPERK01]|uniref:universal stress protein n=1 Tax=Halalkalicoccus sp. NIPERK01 TaxID=3053469 RepID=UPI00256F4057|nr:universal stress protein [Halalkalicoccus sp. NIPERK01]MDL5363872.1 universal stress protein [Halalkalicoccus sp. NIPERK01]